MMPHGLTIKEVTTDTWPDLEELFEGKGGPRNCWCMVWRATSEEAKQTDGRTRKAFLKARVDAGIPVGILAYQNDLPVAWCSVAPKATYRRLDDQPAVKGELIWSIVCFYVQREHRGSGMTRFLSESAIGYAKSNGATMIEAYPVDHDSPSYRFMGFVGMFQSLGFQEIGRAGTRRHVMRLRL